MAEAARGAAGARLDHLLVADMVEPGSVVLEHLLRIARHAVVSFPNFGHWKIRLLLLFGGQMPTTANLPDTWYDTPNIHFCTIKDFRQTCSLVGAKMEKAVALNAWGQQ